jgi:hypothetical protein
VKELTRTEKLKNEIIKTELGNFPLREKNVEYRTKWKKM